MAEFDVKKALESARLNPLHEVEKPPTIITINGRSCMTAGSSSMVIGKAKARKGFLLGAIAATAANGSCTIEGMRGYSNDGKNGVLYFDTEQGEYWGHIAFKRILKAIGSETQTNLKYYNLQQYTPAQRFEMVDKAIMEDDGLSMVIIDGIRDLISSINDETQATEMTSNVLRWCATKQIHVVNVLHQNKADTNARGHIGTELINKAETVLSVTKEKNDELISTVKHEFSKDINISSFSFLIDNDSLPRIAFVLTPAFTKKVDEEKTRFQYVFKENDRMNNALVKTRYMDASGLKDSSADKHIAAALVAGIIVKDEHGNYSLANPTQTESEDETIPF